MTTRKIDRQFLVKHNACSEGYHCWEQFCDGLPTLDQLKTLYATHESWGDWLLVRILDTPRREKLLSWAVSKAFEYVVSISKNKIDRLRWLEDSKALIELVDEVQVKNVDDNDVYESRNRTFQVIRELIYSNQDEYKKRINYNPFNILSVDLYMNNIVWYYLNHKIWVLQGNADMMSVDSAVLLESVRSLTICIYNLYSEDAPHDYRDQHQQEFFAKVNELIEEQAQEEESAEELRIKQIPPTPFWLG